MLAESACVQENGGEHVETRFVSRLGQLAVAEAGVYADGVFLEVGTLQVDSRVIGKNQLCDAEILDFPPRGHRARLAEISVGEGDILFLLGGGDLDRLALLIKCGEDLGAVLGSGLGGQGDGEIPVLPEALQGLVALLESEGLEGHPGDAEGFLGIGKDPVATDAFHQSHCKRGGLASVGPLHCLLGPVENLGRDLIEFGLGESVFQGAAQFLLHHGHRFPPFALDCGDVNGSEFKGVEPFEAARTSRGNGRSFLLGEDVKTAANDRVGHPEWHASGSGGGPVGFRLVLLHESKGQVVALDLLVGEDRGLETEAARDRAHPGIRPRFLGILHGGEGLHDAALVVIEIDITHHDESHVARDVVVGIEGGEAVASGLLDDFLDPDRKAVGDEGIGQEKLELLFHQAHLDRVP